MKLHDLLEELSDPAWAHTFTFTRLQGHLYKQVIQYNHGLLAESLKRPQRDGYERTGSFVTSSFSVEVFITSKTSHSKIYEDQ